MCSLCVLLQDLVHFVYKGNTTVLIPVVTLSMKSQGTPTQAADTDVVSGSPARSGYEPDSAEAELTTEVACSIPENLHVPVPAHEEAPAVKKPLVRSQEVVHHNIASVLLYDSLS